MDHIFFFYFHGLSGKKKKKEKKVIIKNGILTLTLCHFHIINIKDKYGVLLFIFEEQIFKNNHSLMLSSH